MNYIYTPTNYYNLKTITKYWFLEDFNFFQKLNKLSVMKLSEVLEMETVNKGTSIVLNDDGKNKVFFLKKGSIKVVDTVTQGVKYIVKKGNLFGELSLFDKEITSKETAYALEDCVICYIESEAMEKLMEKHNSLKNSVIKIYGLRIRKLERRIHDLLYKDSPTRIKEFILDYLEEFGEINSEGVLVAKNLLSHKEIGNLTNTSRQTVSNVLSEMRKNKIIDYDIKFISKMK